MTVLYSVPITHLSRPPFIRNECIVIGHSHGKLGCFTAKVATNHGSLSSDETRALSSTDDRGQTDHVRVGLRLEVGVRVWITVDLDLWPSIQGELRSWPIHMQKVKVKGQLVRKIKCKPTDGWTDGWTEATKFPLVLTWSVMKLHEMRSGKIRWDVHSFTALLRSICISQNPS